MSHPIIDATQALSGLLCAAEDAGLPAPYSVNVTDYAPSGHERANELVGGIIVAVDTFDDLSAWATWVDEPIASTEGSGDDEYDRHVAYGYVGPFPLRVHALTERRAAAAVERAREAAEERAGVSA